MKIDKDVKLYSIKEISEMYNIQKETLLKRCQKYDYRPNYHNGNYQYLLNKKQVEKITDYYYRRTDALPTIIYVTRTTEIYQSKLNFLTLDKL